MFKAGKFAPKSILTLDEDENTFVYYHCTAVIDPKEEDANQPDDGIHYSWGFKNGSYTLARRDELAELLDQFIGLGVSPSHITLAVIHWGLDSVIGCRSLIQKNLMP